MIPKSNLVRGCLYSGKCCNAEFALWDGKKFIYTKIEWDDDVYHVYHEYINHPEDEGFGDVFIPESEILDFVYITKSELTIGKWYSGIGNTQCAMWIGEYFMESDDKVHVHVEDEGDYPFIPIKEL